MTEKELAAVIRGIAPVVRELIAKGVTESETRVAVLEGQLKALGDVRDRVLVMETKAAMSTPTVDLVDLGPLTARVSALELGLQMKFAETQPVLAVVADLTKDHGGLCDRIVMLETKASLAQPPSLDLTPVTAQIAPLDAALTKAETAIVALTTDNSSLRERIAVLETRAPMPGPAGRDGLDGKDGADGLGFEDIDVSLSGDRTLVFRFARGDKEKTFPVVVGWPKYQQRWIDGKAYVPGDVVSWDGHLWDCQEATDTGQPGVSKAWLQSVTRGRAGKDGKDGRDAVPLPVVSVGRS